MKKFLEDLRIKLINDLKFPSQADFTVPTDIGEEREKIFRKFLNDIFPYYDAFKGNLFGKSCDFVLADKNYHPRFNSVSLNSDRYYQVIPSLVDTVIDLKGVANKQQIEAGIKQCKQIKSFVTPLAFSTNIYSPHSDNKIRNFYFNHIAKHVLVFIDGQADKYLNNLKTFFSKKWIETNKRSLTFTNFWKLPDMIYFLNTNQILLKWYHLKSGEYCCGYLKSNDNGIFDFCCEIEDYKRRTSLYKIKSYRNYFKPTNYIFQKFFRQNVFDIQNNMTDEEIKSSFNMSEYKDQD